MSKRISGYKVYYTRSGDTFDMLSLEMYGDEKLASKIIDFNPDYADTIVFGSGTKLRLPIFDRTDTPQTLAPWRR